MTFLIFSFIYFFPSVLYEWAFIILICLYFLWSMILRLSFILLNTLNFFLTNWYSNFLLECRILISLFFGLCWFEISTIHFHLFFEHILNEIQRKKASNLNNFYTKCQQEINRNNDISYTVTLKSSFNHHPTQTCPICQGSEW